MSVESLEHARRDRASRPAARRDRGASALVIATLALAASPAISLAKDTPVAATAPAAAPAGRAPGQLPLAFIPNVGITDEPVQYLLHAMGGQVRFTRGDVLMRLPGAGASDAASLTGSSAMVNMRLHFVGANPAASVTGVKRLSGVANYYRGRDQSRWRTDIPMYASIQYQQLYPGIDLRYDGDGALLKGTYTVAPGVAPGSIRWQYQGAHALRLDPNTGDLVVTLSAGPDARTLIEKAPIAWQDLDGRRVPVQVRYRLHGKDAAASDVGFEVGAYDPTAPLIIDPTLVYSTFTGNPVYATQPSGAAEAVATDGYQNAYVASSFFGDPPPPPPPDDDQVYYLETETMVMKLLPGGNDFEFLTIISATGAQVPQAITVDPHGNSYVTGYTSTRNDDSFPSTPNAFQSQPAGVWDAWVAKLDASGHVTYLTCMGGSNNDVGRGITIDSSGRIYVVGETSSKDFPLRNALDSYMSSTTRSNQEGFIARISASGDLDYSTYYGGDGRDKLQAVTLDGYGNVYFVGSSIYPSSQHIPLVNAYDKTYNGRYDCVIGSLNGSGTSWRFSTYLGGDGDDACYSLVVDGNSHLYVTGFTSSSTTSLPMKGSGHVKHGALGGRDVFVAKMPRWDRKSIEYMVRIGGQGNEGPLAMKPDSLGNLYVTGYTYSADFPVKDSLQAFNQGASTTSSDGFVIKLARTDRALLYSTYLGSSANDSANSIAVDGANNIFVAGDTQGADFPVTSGAYSEVYTSGSYTEGFVIRIAQ